MIHSHLNVFEHTVEITTKWLNDLSERLDWHDQQRAYQALRAVLHAVRDRLGVNDAAHLAAQLPLLVRGIYYEGYHPSGKPLPQRRKSAFLAHVQDEFREEVIEIETMVRAALQVVADHITPGELDKIKSVMPEDIRSLWP